MSSIPLLKFSPSLWNPKLFTFFFSLNDNILPGMSACNKFSQLLFALENLYSSSLIFNGQYFMIQYYTLKLFSLWPLQMHWTPFSLLTWFRRGLKQLRWHFPISCFIPEASLRIVFYYLFFHYPFLTAAPNFWDTISK